MRHTTISIDNEMYEKIESFLSGTKSVSQFCFDATEEKIKRMEVRDKNARMQLHHKDVVLLEPVILDVLKMHGLMD